MFDGAAPKAFVAIGCIAGIVGLGLDIAAWGWVAAPAVLLPAGLCAAAVVVYFRAEDRETSSS